MKTDQLMNREYVCMMYSTNFAPLLIDGDVYTALNLCYLVLVKHFL